MNNEKYTSLELGVLLFFLLNSFTSVILIKSFSTLTSIEIIASILISFLLGIFILKRFFKSFNNNFLENICSNKIVKNIIKIFLIIGSSTLLIYVIFNLSIIIKDVILPNMNQSIIALVFLIVGTILSIKGMKSISIASSLLFFIYIIVCIINIAFNFLNVDPINLLPMNIDIYKIDFIQILILTLSPIFLLLTIPKNKIDNFKDFEKKGRLFYIIFYVYLSIKVLFILSILGEKYFALFNFPELEILKLINIFNFFERLEEVLIINIFIEHLVVAALALNYISTISNSFLKLGNKVYILIDIVIFLILVKLGSLRDVYLTVILFIFMIINLFIHKKKYRE